MGSKQFKPPKADEKRVRQWLEKWRTRLFLHEWFIRFDYPDTDPQPTMSGGEVLAEAEVSVPYKMLTVKLYKPFFRKGLKTQEHSLVHELCHAHTQEMWDIAGSLRNGVMYHDYQVRDAVEALTQRMSIIAFRDEWKREA